MGAVPTRIEAAASQRRLVLLSPIFVVGIVWGVVYRQTRSLRWPIFGHFLQDLFAPPVLVFLNLLVIPSVTP
jgi:CAAX protease family protein